MAVKKETRNTLILVGAVALVVVLVLSSRKSSTPAPSSGGTLGGVTGLLNSAGSVIKSAGGVFTSIWKSNPPSDGDYTPQVYRGDDTDLSGNGGE